VRAENAFAVWLTGLPSSGKSTIARALLAALQARGLKPAVLESDVLRTQLTPKPTYEASERELFYSALVHLAEFLCRNGVPVLIDATANRRAYRDCARARIVRFAEVLVECPLELCKARDVKGLYRAASEGRSATLPGAQAAYERPASPDLIVRGDAGSPEAAAAQITELLRLRAWL
jgi:adenylylsulfate kinase